LTYPVPAEPDAAADETAAVQPADIGVIDADCIAIAEIELVPFVEFYRHKRDRIARALALTLGDGDLGADAADEALARAYQRWDRVGTFADPAGWVYRVGLNWATSVLRRRSRAPIAPVDRDPTDVAAPAEPDIAAALAELPVHQRAAVVCRFYLGLTEQETAAALRIRPGTVKSRLHRALRQLETRLAHLSPKETS
jgi:RNA polymerase sigma-70 factor (ECF subfamily)